MSSAASIYYLGSIYWLISHTPGRLHLSSLLSLVVSDVSPAPGAVVIIGVLPGDSQCYKKSQGEDVWKYLPAPGVILHTVKESPPVPGFVEGAGLREVTRVAPGAHLEAVRPPACHVAPVGGSRLAVEAEVARAERDKVRWDCGGSYHYHYLLPEPDCRNRGGKEWTGGPSTAVTPWPPADTWCSNTFTQHITHTTTYHHLPPPTCFQSVQ